MQYFFLVLLKIIVIHISFFFHNLMDKPVLIDKKTSIRLFYIDSRIDSIESQLKSLNLKINGLINDEMKNLLKQQKVLEREITKLIHERIDIAERLHG